MVLATATPATRVMLIPDVLKYRVTLVQVYPVVLTLTAPAVLVTATPDTRVTLTPDVQRLKPVPTQPRLLLVQASVKTLGLLLAPKTERPITTVAVRLSVLPDRPVPTELVRTPVPTQPRLLLAQASVKTLGLLLAPKTERPITTVVVRLSVLPDRPVPTELV